MIYARVFMVIQALERTQSADDFIIPVRTRKECPRPPPGGGQWGSRSAGSWKHVFLRVSMHAGWCVTDSSTHHFCPEPALYTPGAVDVQKATNVEGNRQNSGFITNTSKSARPLNGAYRWVSALKKKEGNSRCKTRAPPDAHKAPPPPPSVIGLKVGPRGNRTKRCCCCGQEP